MDEQDAQKGQEQAPTRRAAGRLRSVPGPTSLPGSQPDLLIDLDERVRPRLSTVGSSPDAPRHPGLDALLKDVDDLRATVRRDLGLAATAAAAGEPGFAAFLLGETDTEVRDFEGRSQRRIAELTEPELPLTADVVESLPARARNRRLLPAAPLVAAAAALFMGLSGSLPTIGGGSPGSVTSNAANRSLNEIAVLSDAGASPEMVGAASEQLHDDMATLIAAASNDPAAAQRAIDILTREVGLLDRSADSAHPELRAALAEARTLVRLLKRATRKTVPSAPKVTIPVEAPQAESSPKPRSTTSSKPSSKPSPSATPAPTKPASSPSPSSSPTSKPSGSSDPTVGPDNPLPGY